MFKQKKTKDSMPAFLIVFISDSGNVKRLESFDSLWDVREHNAEHALQNRIILSYRRNCLAKENLTMQPKPARAFPKLGMFAIWRPGPRFTVFHETEEGALHEGSRVAAREGKPMGLYEVTEILKKQLPKAERGERRRVRVSK